MRILKRRSVPNLQNLMPFDVHGRAAGRMFGVRNTSEVTEEMRDRAKTIDRALLYGGLPLVDVDFSEIEERVARRTQDGR